MGEEELGEQVASPSCTSPCWKGGSARDSFDKSLGLLPHPLESSIVSVHARPSCASLVVY